MRQELSRRLRKLEARTQTKDDELFRFDDDIVLPILNAEEAQRRGLTNELTVDAIIRYTLGAPAEGWEYVQPATVEAIEETAAGWASRPKTDVDRALDALIAKVHQSFGGEEQRLKLAAGLREIRPGLTTEDVSQIEHKIFG